jgi:excisionase family DNA binding protein
LKAFPLSPLQPFHLLIFLKGVGSSRQALPVCSAQFHAAVKPGQTETKSETLVSYFGTVQGSNKKDCLSMAENYYTTRDAAKILGVSLRTAQKWLEKGQLEGWKTQGGHRRITRSSVMRAIGERRRESDVRRLSYSLPVLIIEDDLTLLKLYRLQLSKWPFQVAISTAPNGFEGLVMVGETNPRMVICDLRLPGVNGFQIVRALCAMERYSRMAIVVASSLPPAEINAHGGLPPQVEIVGKPVNFSRLREIAQSVLRAA